MRPIEIKVQIGKLDHIPIRIGVADRHHRLDRQTVLQDAGERDRARAAGQIEHCLTHAAVQPDGGEDASRQRDIGAAQDHHSGLELGHAEALKPTTWTSSEMRSLSRKIQRTGDPRGIAEPGIAASSEPATRFRCAGR
jgi:hypothetical protein